MSSLKSSMALSLCTLLLLAVAKAEVSTAVANANAGPGQSVKHTVVVKDGATLVNQKESSSTQAASWDSAPSCPTGTSLSIKFDSNGKPWAWDDSKKVSCAVRSSAATFESAPTCDGSPTSANSKQDTMGRSWGWKNGASCAFRDSAGKPLALVQSSSRRSLQAVDSTNTTSTPSVSTKTTNVDVHRDKFNSAPACTFAPTKDNSVTDQSGRLWGHENNASCAFRSQVYGTALYYAGYVRPSNATDIITTPAPAPVATNVSAPVTTNVTVPVPQVDAPPANISKQPAGWDVALVCPFAPTEFNFEVDQSNRKWGWHNGRSCRFVDTNGKPHMASAVVGGGASAPKPAKRMSRRLFGRN